MGRTDNDNKSAIGAEVDLVAWDPESDQHIERLRLQRLACGWNSDTHVITTWREQQRQGKIGLRWVVLRATNPGTSALLASHIAGHPSEASPIHDTAAHILNQPLQPSSGPFTPVGHISIDMWDADPISGAENSAPGVLHIATFYVSSAIQRGGLGRATMDAAEDLARELGARTIMLNTMSKDECNQSDPRSIAFRLGVPIISNEDWYIRRGYTPYAWKDEGFRDTDAAGKEWWIKKVYLRKELSP